VALGFAARPVEPGQKSQALHYLGKFRALLRQIRGPIAETAKMEIKASFDPGDVMRLLDDIERKTEELRGSISTEMADWQEQDMNRKQAISRAIVVERPSGNFTRAGAVIWPTSRRRVKLRRRKIRRLKKAGQHERIIQRTKPVLRPHLLVRFKDRFRNLLDRAY
jgi:hypothetical protein